MTNVYSIADRRNLPCDGQAARLPQGARQGAGVESGENAAGEPNRTTGLIARRPSQTPGCSPAAQIATRDADTDKGSGVPLNDGGAVLPPPLPSSLVATIAGCPVIRIDGRNTYLLGRVGIAWRDAIGWRWAASIGAPAHDIWNVAFIDALDARANQ